MRSFSERKGLKPIRTKIQLDSIDEDLLNGLWNVLCMYYWDIMERARLHRISEHFKMKFLFHKLWHNHFKHPLDTLDDIWLETYKWIRDYFFSCKWYEVYDFLEFIANNYEDTDMNNNFMSSCNSILEKEMSAYRFVGGAIVQITTKNEMEEIEQALKIPSAPVSEHLKRALDFLSDRKDPDYRNSIKEAICGVESLCKIISGNEKGTLSNALKVLETKMKLHSSLKFAFDKLYGYSSDKGGIRHSLLGESDIDFEDAKFMLVSCSAFINYLIVKAAKAKIKI